MQAIQIIFLCIGAALVCAMLRVQRPEIAAMVSLAVGIGALLLTGRALGDFSENIRRIFAAVGSQSAEISTVMKAAGITILGELGVQVCTDAGESALAGRIRLACRAVILGMALPFIVQIAETMLTVQG